SAFTPPAAANAPFEETVRRVTPPAAVATPAASAAAPAPNFGPLPEHEETIRRVVRASAVETPAEPEEVESAQAPAMRQPDVDPTSAIQRLKQRVEEAAPAIRRPATNWDEPE